MYMHMYVFMHVHTHTQETHAWGSSILNKELDSNFGAWKLSGNWGYIECENYVLYQQGLGHFNKIKMWHVYIPQRILFLKV